MKTIELTSTCFEFKSDANLTDEQEKVWNNFIFKVIEHRFCSKNLFVTIWNPANDSLANNLPNTKFVKDNKFVHVTSLLTNVSNEDIHMIIQSWEFELGNIRLLDGLASNLDDKELIAVINYNYIAESEIRLKQEMIWSDSDGQSLYWFNAGVPASTIVSL